MYIWLLVVALALVVDAAYGAVAPLALAAPPVLNSDD
jgi:hypothetical protein